LLYTEINSIGDWDDDWEAKITQDLAQHAADLKKQNNLLKKETKKETEFFKSLKKQLKKTDLMELQSL
jgi:uncharacterized membrane protein